MKCYRIDYAANRTTARLWVDCPNLLCAVIVGWVKVRRLHRPMSRKPGRSFMVTLEDA